MRARKRPKKKLRITGFTDVPSARTADVSAASWEKLQSAVVAVQTSTAVDLSREELYSVRFAPPPLHPPPAMLPPPPRGAAPLYSPHRAPIAPSAPAPTINHTLLCSGGR